MNKIGTHNSVTGEESKGLLSFLVALFSKCQSKTIKELYEAGCRYFDIRVKIEDNKWVCKHGLWTANKSALDVFKELNSFDEPVFMRLTYCGSCHESEILQLSNDINLKYKHIKITTVNIKKPKWKTIKTYNHIKSILDFVVLDGHSWHTYIPIPFLWKKIYHNKPNFNKTYYKLVDFL